MKGPGYRRCGSLREALELKSRLGKRCIILAGGTDLVINLRAGKADLSGAVICDISSILDCRFIRKEGGKIRIGPLVTHADLEESGILRSLARVLSEAAGSVGSPQIRAMGTIGGNVCNASPSADTVPALLACDAVLELASARGERDLDLSRFLKRPYGTDIRADEILSCITLTCPPRGAGMSFLKLGRRNACSIARMNFAAVLGKGREGRMRRVRVAAGAVAPVAMRFLEIENFLEDKKPSSELFQEAGRMMARKMIEVSGRRWSTPYKEPVVASLLRRVLEQASGIRG